MTLFIWLKLIFLVVGSATAGAIVSKAINEGTISWYWAVSTSVLSGLSWGWIAKNKDISLVYASVLYDVLYAITYVVFLAYAGEKITTMQAVGVGISILGVAIAGWHQ